MSFLRIAPIVLLVSVVAGALITRSETRRAAAARRDAARRARPPQVKYRHAPPPALPPSNMMYTTYFFTAAEAVVHGYEKNTQVRIVSLAENATVWKGVVNEGETKLIPTGRGAFSFLSDKKASLLAGTPSSCTAVGYFVRDREGTYVSDRLITQLPSSISTADARLLVWAWEDVELTITDSTADRQLFRGALKAGAYHELDSSALARLGSHVLSFRASKRALAVQVYYDEGFVVPSREGRAVGRDFRTYVGKITEGKNDLNVIAYGGDARVSATDLKSGETIWSGVVRKGEIKSVTLAGRYVRVTSDRDVAASVIPFEHYKGMNGMTYAEHHYGAGAEGTGIDHDFLLPTPKEIWIFSYYDGNRVTVSEAAGGRAVWSGVLKAGQAHGLTPGYGLYRIKSSMGSSVMGGSNACGGDYTPAAGMFRVDEEVLRAAQQVVEERRREAAAHGRTLTEAEAAAPLSAAEAARVQRAASGKLHQSLSVDEVQARIRVHKK
jgi:hypothetical protein